ncbi:MAG: helix-turn-helix domain-containing protein [Candidatus Dormibacteraeota bacterium]|nr:helix-turn-helix domain-containing protein [Candidatus Dormibacteraeota bacterium]
MTSEELVELRDVRAFVRTGRARQTRLRAGLSLSEVAQSVGVSVAAVYRWETSDRTPRGEAAVRYWRLLQQLKVAS